MSDTHVAHTRTWPVLALLCAAQLMLILDVSVVNIALPSMQRDLGFSAGNLQWVIGGYALTFGGLLILGGRSGDLFGRVRLFRLGLVVFTLASLLGGLAQAPWMLVTGRLLQGVGAAMVAPAALALLTTAFSEGEARNRALGVWGAASAAGGAVGILVGGPLTELSWRAVLLINVPIGVGAVLVAPFLLSESRDRVAPRLDVTGAVLITTAMGALVYGLSSATAGFNRPNVLAALLVGMVLVAAFLMMEARTQHPLVPLRVFSMRNLTGGNAIALLLFGVSTCTVYFLTLYLQQVLGYSALLTGLAFLPNAVLVGITAPLAGRLVSRVGIRTLMASSMAILAVGELLFVRIGTDSSYLGVVLPGILLNAVGLGGAFVGASVAATTSVPYHDQGLATSLFTTAQQIGAAIGLAILVVVTASATARPEVPEDVVAGFRWGFGGAGVFAVVALAIALLVVREEQPDAGVSMSSTKHEA